MCKTKQLSLDRAAAIKQNEQKICKDHEYKFYSRVYLTSVCVIFENHLQKDETTPLPFDEIIIFFI